MNSAIDLNQNLNNENLEFIVNNWKELYIARMNLVERFAEILKCINGDMWDENAVDLVNRVNRIPNIPNIDFDFFQKAIDEYGINERDSLSLLFNNTETTLKWRLQNKDHYNNWREAAPNLIEELLALEMDQQQIVESYLRNNAYNIENIYSAKDILDAYIGDFTIKQFVEDSINEMLKYLTSNCNVSLDYEKCLDAIISDYGYVIIRLDENNIRVFKY